MRILVVGEGAHEVPPPAEQEEGVSGPAGALAIFVSRLLSGENEYAYDRVRRVKELRKKMPGAKRLHGVRGRKGMKRTSLLWMLHAQQTGYDALVLVVDNDQQPDRIKEINEAQDSDHVRISRALGVAIESFDAWILADEVALSWVLDRPVETQPDPESIPYPKPRCKELASDALNAVVLREVYAAVAEHADLNKVKQRCPKGFAPFAQRVRALE